MLFHGENEKKKKKDIGVGGYVPFGERNNTGIDFSGNEQDFVVEKKTKEKSSGDDLKNMKEKEGKQGDKGSTISDKSEKPRLVLRAITISGNDETQGSVKKLNTSSGRRTEIVPTRKIPITISPYDTAV